MRKVYFDYNLLNLQSAGLPAVETEQKLIDSASKSVLYAAVIATNLEHAVALESRITNLTAVSSVESMTKFLAEDQTRKLGLVNDIKCDLAPIHFDPPDPRPVAIPELSGTLYSTYGYLGAAYHDVTNDPPALKIPHPDVWLNQPLDTYLFVRDVDEFIGWMNLTNDLMSLHGAIQNLRKEMLREDFSTPETNAFQLASFQQALFEDV